MSAKAEKGRLVSVDYSTGNDLLPVHANQVIVQHSETEFIVTFFEVLPPVINPDPSRQAKEVERLRTIKARPVARIVMSPDRARALLTVLTENVQRYESNVGLVQSEEE